MKIVKTYKNTKNNGQERVIRDGDKFYVCSNWGDGFGPEMEVSRQQVAQCMDYTNAPSDVVSSILG